MALISLEEAKAYLRLDSAFEDSLVRALLSSAEHLCGDVARLSDEQYEAVFGGAEEIDDTEETESSDETVSQDELDGEETGDDESGDDEISTTSVSLDGEETEDEADEDEEDPVYSDAELAEAQNLCRIGSLYALAYLFEHREEADYHDLVITLRSILFALREDKVQ